MKRNVHQRLITLAVNAGLLTIAAGYLWPVIALPFRAALDWRSVPAWTAPSTAGDIRLQSAVFRSSVVGTIVSLLAVLLVVIAFGSTRRVKNSTVALAMLPLFVPEAAHGLFVSLVPGEQLAGKWLGVVSAEIVFVLPFAVAGYATYASRLPLHWWTASDDLGISSIAFLRRVYLRHALPVLLSIFFFCFLLCFNELTRASYLAPREMFAQFVASEMKSGTTRSMYLIASMSALLGFIALVLLNWRALSARMPE